MQHDPSCESYRTLSRRGFLGASAATASLLTSGVAFGRPGTGRPTLVGVFLRGAIDGLSVVVPYGDSDLYSARPTLAVGAPGTPDGALDLDGFFGLNPNASDLMPAFSDGRLAIAHACGSPDPSRSHFDAMQSMETGNPVTPGSPLASGWLARHLQSVAAVGSGDLRGISVDTLVPRVLAQAPGTLPIPDPANFDLSGNPVTAADRRMAIENAYAGAIPPLGPAAASSLSAIDLLAGINFDLGAGYPASPFGQALRHVANLIRADVGLEVAHIDYGGWDHHDDQGPLNGTLAGMLQDLAASLHAFYTDLQSLPGSYVLYAKSEFGRRVAENGSAGTDHGSGGIMMVLGDAVNGGQVYADWPSLAPSQLDEGDLRVTTDYRDVLSEVLQNGLGGTDLPFVFPGHARSGLGIVS